MENNNQAKNINPYIECQENSKANPSSSKIIIGRIIRLVFPFIYLFIRRYYGVIIELLLPYITIIGCYVLHFLCNIFIALVYIAYGINVAKHEKRKYLFALYFPIMTATVVNIFFFLDIGENLFIAKNLLYVIYLDFLFVKGITFWTLISVWIYSRKNKPQKVNEASSVTEESPSISEEDKTDSEQQAVFQTITLSRGIFMDNKIQTENVDTFFDNTDKKKEKSAKVKRIIKRILQLIIPFLFYPFLMLFALIISILFPIPDLSAIVPAAGLILFVFLPLYCFIYGIFVASSGKRSYLFAIYNGFVSILSTFIFEDLRFHIAYKLPFSIMFCVISFLTFIPIGIYKLYIYCCTPENTEKTSTITEESPSISEEDKTDSEQ